MVAAVILLLVIGLWYGLCAGAGTAEKDFKDKDEFE